MADREVGADLVGSRQSDNLVEINTLFQCIVVVQSVLVLKLRRMVM